MAISKAEHLDALALAMAFKDKDQSMVVDVLAASTEDEKAQLAFAAISVIAMFLSKPVDMTTTHYVTQLWEYLGGPKRTD